MSELNKRQFDLMLERLIAFERETIGLEKLISDLDGLLNSLENLDGDWRNSFLKQRGILEDVYADTLDQKLKELPGEHEILIDNAIGRLRKLIEQ